MSSSVDSPSPVSSSSLFVFDTEILGSSWTDFDCWTHVLLLHNRLFQSLNDSSLAHSLFHFASPSSLSTLIFVSLDKTTTISSGSQSTTLCFLPRIFHLLILSYFCFTHCIFLLVLLFFPFTLPLTIAFVTDNWISLTPPASTVLTRSSSRSARPTKQALSALSLRSSPKILMEFLLDLCTVFFRVRLLPVRSTSNAGGGHVTGRGPSSPSSHACLV